jgi:hypothetical protein
MRLARLREEFDDVRDDIFELLEDLGAVEILRAHTPPSERWVLDRLENAVRLLDRLQRDIRLTEAQYDRITLRFQTDNGEPQP